MGTITERKKKRTARKMEGKTEEKSRREEKTHQSGMLSIRFLNHMYPKLLSLSNV